MWEKLTSRITIILKALWELTLFSWCFFLLFAVGIISGLFEKVSPKTYAINSPSSLEQELLIEAKDWWPAQVGFRFTNRAAEFQYLEFSISSTESVEIEKLPMGWTFEESQVQGERYYYILIVPYSPGIEKTHTLKFIDTDDYATTREIVITPQVPVAVTGWPTPKYYLDADQLITVVNKEYRIPQDYIPTDLVNLAENKINVWFASTQLRKEPTDQLVKMLAAADDEGFTYMVTSGFRSFADQVRVYNELIKTNAGDIFKTDQLSARPGYSEHQLGTTIDITSAENRYQTEGFEFTKLSKWLVENAHEYGFVLSFPEGSTAETGFDYEPWHYRYIGVENIKKLKQSGLSLNSWLMEENKKSGLIK